MSGYYVALILSIFLIFSIQETYSQALSGNIQRIADTTNQYLYKAEKQIKNGKPEYARPRLKAARRQYTHMMDSLKSDHPVLVKIKKRISKVDSLLTAAAAENKGAPKIDDTGTRMELAADALRRIKAADRKLIWVKLKDYNGTRARKDLDAAQEEYENIFKYQKGRYNPDHPQILDLKKRIDEAEKMMKVNSANDEGKVPAHKDSSAVMDLQE